MTILVNRPGEELLPETGEVVATGVRRDPPFPESGTAASWATIVATLDHGALPLMLEATRRRLARYGPDLRAWERARREYSSSPGAVAFAERIARIRASSDAADAGRQRRRIYEMLGTPPGEDDGGHGDEPA